jgi:hypothetical protein
MLAVCSVTFIETYTFFCPYPGPEPSRWNALVRRTVFIYIINMHPFKEDSV